MRKWNKDYYYRYNVCYQASFYPWPKLKQGYQINNKMEYIGVGKNIKQFTV